MSRHEPLLPNAARVAAREYRERVRSRLFIVSTVILALIAGTIALGPLVIRLAERTTVQTLTVVADEPAVESLALGSLDTILNLPPSGTEPLGWVRPYQIEAGSTADEEIAAVEAGAIAGTLLVERVDSGGLSFVFHTAGQRGSTTSQLVGFAALGTAILDWQSSGEVDPGAGAFRVPGFDIVARAGATEGGRPVDPTVAASRSFLAIAFVVLIFITLVIYGMWVAAGVATEKSSRVMELLVSAASAEQLLAGKVVGLGAAGLTQYAAILAPAGLILVIQDLLAVAIMGPAAGETVSLAGLTPGLLAAFLGYFVLGFAFYAVIYAAAGSLVSRQEDLQVVALPLSLLSMAGYLIAIVSISGGFDILARIASFVPFWSPFVMLARVMVSRVEPWELGLSLGLLAASVLVAAVVAVRVYRAGILLYGQRPGLRLFIAAARRGD